MDDLEKRLQQSVDNVKRLVSSFSLQPDEKKKILRYIHSGKPVFASFNLNENQMKRLNRAANRANDAYDSAYRAARACPAVSEWMSEPTDIVYGIWDSLKK